ncbi:MAG: hypothetical protein J5858_16740 [Lentisphaeria bacterium]|nr:hypothetical protein [Lentisphaeria bacterium]
MSGFDTQPQAPYNIYLYESLIAAASLNHALDKSTRGTYFLKKANDLGQIIENTFYNVPQVFYTVITKEEGYEHLQAIMLANGLVPKEKQSRILNLLKSGTLRSIDLSALYYLISGLLNLGPNGRSFLIDSLRRILEPIVLSSATSL